MIITKLCANCSSTFIPRPQSPNQQFCPESTCQKMRRKSWRQKKIAADPDYRLNQSRAQRAWLDRNPDYWRKYRKNREIKGDTKSFGGQIGAKQPLSGFYQMRFISKKEVAKSDAWIVEITPINDV